MTSRPNLVRITPVGTTTATTTPWPLPASPGALRFHALPIFSLDASYRNPRRSTVKYGTCLKIMVSPVRARVPPLLFSTYFQEPLALFAALTEGGIHHKCHHNGHSLEALREVVVEAHGRLTMHGGGDVGVGVARPRGLLLVSARTHNAVQVENCTFVRCQGTLSGPSYPQVQ